VLIGVGGVAADGVDGGFDVYLYIVNIDISALCIFSCIAIT
jgi:hypothetical protein